MVQIKKETGNIQEYKVDNNAIVANLRCSRDTPHLKNPYHLWKRNQNKLDTHYKILIYVNK